MLASLAAAALLLAPPSPPGPPSPAPPAVVRPAVPRAGAAPGAEDRLLGEWPSRPSGKRISLSDKSRIDRALRKIADAAGWSLVANTGRAGERTVVLNLKDVPVEEALRAVLEGTALAATRRGDTVTVAPYVAPAAESPVLTGFDAPSGKKVNADFSDTPVDKALRQIADAAGWSIVLPPGLRGAVSARFRNAPAEDALRAVLSQSSLSASREGAVITVSREFGPRVVVRGGKRQLLFDFQGDKPSPPAPEDVERIKEEAIAAAEEAREAAAEDEDAPDEVAGPAIDSKGRVKTGNVTVGPGERKRDVVALRGDVRMQAGSSARQVTAVLGSVELEPGVNVDGEVVAIGGNVHVSSGARVGRDAVSVGGDVVIDPGGTVDGEQVSVSIPGLAGLMGLLGGSSGPAEAKVSPFLRVVHLLAKYAVLFVLGLLVLTFAPARLDAVSNAVGRQPGKVVLAGLLGTLAMPVLTVLLVVTVVGIPLVAVQVIAVLLAAVVGFGALALFIGRAVPIPPRLAAARVAAGTAVEVSPPRTAAVLQLAIGTAVVVAVTQIPVVGVLAWVTGWLFAFGAVLRTRFGQAQPGVPLSTAPAAPPPQAA